DYKTLKKLLALDVITYQQGDAKYDSDDVAASFKEKDRWKKMIYKGDINPNKKDWYKAKIVSWWSYPDYMLNTLNFYQQNQEGALSQQDVIDMLQALNKKKFPFY